MDPLLKKFIEHLRSVRLSDKEREKLRASLIAKMRGEGAQRPVLSPWSRFFHGKRVQLAALSLVIIVSYGSSVTLAAESALPGDVLYPIKTQVTEPVARFVVATTPAAEAKFETKLLERRLEEVEVLEASKKLDPEIAHSVREAILEQSIKAKKKIKDAEDESAAGTQVVATPTAAAATSSPKTSPENVSEESHLRQNVSDNAKNEADQNEGELKTVLKNHERILEKLDLGDEKVGKSEKGSGNGREGEGR